MEVWKDIPEYESLYQISTLGRLKGFQKGERILRLSKSNLGYFHTTLFKEGNHRNVLIHRLVALTFLPNPENKPTVDHINRDKEDNRLENLRWASYSEQFINKHYANDDTNQRCIRKHRLRWVVQIERDRQIVFRMSYATLQEAQEARDEFLGIV